MLAGNATTVGITVAQAFLLVPLCLRLLSPQLYGAWIAGTELLLWAQQFDVGVTHLLTQRVGAALGRGRLDEAARWSATCLVAMAGIGLALLIVGSALAPLVVLWLQAPENDAARFVGAFRLGLIASVLLLVSSVVTATSRGMQQPGITTTAGVLGALFAFIASIGLLLAGWGVWALAIGLVVRSVVVVTGSAVYVAGLPGRLGDWVCRPSRSVAGEVWSLTPPMAAGSAGYLLANNSEILLVTTLFGPVPALAYALTRRAMDGLRSLVESIGLAAAPGFAHLVAARDRYRARGVARELLWLRLAAACLGAAMVVSVNEPFVGLLFGSQHFGGLLLTSLFAGHLVMGGQAMLLNHLLRAAGQVRESAWLRVAEAVGRVVGMGAGLALMGLAGAPAASLLVSLGVTEATRARLGRAMPDAPGEGGRMTTKDVLVPLGVLLFGIVVATLDLASSFPSIGLILGGVAVACGPVLWWTRPPGVWPQGFSLPLRRKR